MNSNRTIWHLLTWVALVLPATYLAYTWADLPARIPTHFGLDGSADGYTAKRNIWLFCLALPLGVYLLLTYLPRLDPKRRLDAARARREENREQAASDD